MDEKAYMERRWPILLILSKNSSISWLLKSWFPERMVLKCKKKFSPTKIDLVSSYFDFDMVGASPSLENKGLLLLVSCDKKTKVLLIFKIKLTWYGKLEICIIHSDKKITVESSFIMGEILLSLCRDNSFGIFLHLL